RFGEGHDLSLARRFAQASGAGWGLTSRPVSRARDSESGVFHAEIYGSPDKPGLRTLEHIGPKFAHQRSVRLPTLALGLSLLAGCSAYADGAEEVTSQDLTNLPACAPLNVCEAPAWSYETRGWKHSITSTVVSHLGDAHHRGRDMFYVPGEKQTVH